MDRESVGQFNGSRENALRLHREVDILSMSQLCIDLLATLMRHAVEVPMYCTKGRSGDPHFCEVLNREVSNKTLATAEDDLLKKRTLTAE